MSKKSVNDIFFKFVNPDVYDVRQKKLEYIKDRDQFKNYINAKKKLEKKEEKTEEKINRYVEKRIRYLNIDSSDRKVTIYPNANSYTIDITKENFSNVSSVEMISSQFVNINKTIRNTPLSLKNNVIQWNISDDMIDGQYIAYSVELTPGNYSAAALENEIESKMNSIPRINGLTNNFNVTIDVLVDEVKISSYQFTTLFEPFGVIMGSNEVIVSFPNHNFVVGEEFLVQQSISIGTLLSSELNQIHIVSDVIDENNFKFVLSSPSPVTGAEEGGDSVLIGQGVDFRLLFHLNYSPAIFLGFAETMTDFEKIHINNQEYFIDETEVRLKINTILPGSPGIVEIRTTLPHNLNTGDRIFIYDIGIDTIPYHHDYNTSPLTIDDMHIRDEFVSNLTTTTGVLITVVDDYTISTPLTYGNYHTISGDKISVYINLNVADNEEFGDIVLKKVNKNLNFIGKKYIVICSNILNGNFSASNDTIKNVFAKIQLSGEPNDIILNSYVGGKKIFYNNSLEFLDFLDFSFKFNDGQLVDFVDNEHTFVLKITQLIQKMEDTDFNSKIGVGY